MGNGCVRSQNSHIEESDPERKILKRVFRHLSSLQVASSNLAGRANAMFAQLLRRHEFAPRRRSITAQDRKKGLMVVYGRADNRQPIQFPKTREGQSESIDIQHAWYCSRSIFVFHP